MTRFLFALASLGAAVFCGGTLRAGDCAALTDLDLPGIRIDKAAASAGEEAPAENLPAGAPSRLSKAVAPHCRVEGVVGGEIRFELLLPDDWNGKFLMGGGGGFVGSLGFQGRFSINRGYATVATDTGHRAPGIRADWARNQLERQVNYGYLGVHRTAEAAKAVIRSYYGKAAKHSYFYGCSNGGRQALMEAQRYPRDFDGIAAGAPAHDFTGVLAAFAYNMQRIFPDPNDVENPVITADNRKLLQASILEQCDALDGVEDGVLNDPRECGFRLSSLPLCPGGAAAPHCLTVAQREAIAAVYAGPRNRDGQIYPGFPLGGEAERPTWQNWITGPNAGLLEAYGEPSSQFGFATQGFKHLIFDDPEWSYASYDFETFESDSKNLASIADATDTDISAFKAAGGKLILWHGWMDAALTAYASIDYFEAVEKADPDVRDYFRLFMMPGVFHCAGGPGPDRVDWLAAIENWVEKGVPPEQPRAVRVSGGKLEKTRPLCVHPKRAVYKGSGSANDAANFVCEAPPERLRNAAPRSGAAGVRD